MFGSLRFSVIHTAFIPIFIINFVHCLVCRVVLTFRDDTFSTTRSRRLHTTSEQLGAAAASTTISACYYLSFSHCLFCGDTAAVAPPRSSTEGKPPVVRSALIEIISDVPFHAADRIGGIFIN